MPCDLQTPTPNFVAWSLVLGSRPSLVTPLNTSRDGSISYGLEGFFSGVSNSSLVC